MQLTHTDFARFVGQSGRLMDRVTFRGDGGEKITVELEVTDISNSNSSNAAVLNRARGILVQTATFDLAENEYEARSDGDELGTVTASDAKDELYVLEYREADSWRRVPPSYLPSLQSARAEALRSAVDLLAELPETLPDDAPLVRVYSSTGELLIDVDFAAAKSASQSFPR